MPNRIIREAILSSEKMARLNAYEEVFFRRLMSIVDDFGRYEANPQLLRSKCYPLQTDAVPTTDITKWLVGCQKAGLLVVYVVAGKQYLEVINFGQQQRSASKFPPVPADAINCYQLQADAHLDVSVFGVVSEVVSVKSPDKPAMAATTFVAPEWVPEEQWKSFVQMRKAMKSVPFTNAAAAGIVRELEKLKAQGHDPASVLENSVMNGWRSVFAPKTALQGKTWADNKADVAHATVPGTDEVDPALAKILADEKKAAPMPEAIRARLASLKQSPTAP